MILPSVGKTLMASASDQKDQESEKSKISEKVRPLGFRPPKN
jgi:hypothetical protein